MKKDLETEAKEYMDKKKPRKQYQRKTLTPRQQVAAAVLAGLLQGSRSSVHQTQLLNEAFNWADAILDYDGE